MARMHVIQSWSDGAAYSGEQIQARLSQGKALHFKKSGMANTELYTQDDEKPKSKPSIRDRISLADRHFSRMEAMSKELEDSLDNGTVTLIEYQQLKPIMNARLEKAWLRLSKQHGWVEEEAVQYPSTEQSSTPIQTSNETPYSCGKTTTKNNDSCQDIPSWLLELSPSNCLKNPAIKACKGWKKAVQLSQAVRNYINELKDL